MISRGETIRSRAHFGPAWYCVLTQPKHEHIAAAQLKQFQDLQPFLPRIRYQRATKLGPAWVTEALFPNYLFVKFDLFSGLRRVQNGKGVRAIVHFGGNWPVVPEETIDALRATLGYEEVRVLPSQLQPGDAVEIACGPLGGLQAVVSRVLPSQQRIAVLLDFLGRQVSVELAAHEVASAEAFPQKAAFAVNNL